MYESNGPTIFWLASPLVWLGIYLYFSLCLFTIAKKVGHENTWWAFVPILNIIQIIQMAGKPLYWFLFLFIPIFNIVAIAMIWIEIARAREKSPIWGVCMILPFISLLAILILALGESNRVSAYQHAPQPETEKHPTPTV
nr:hypothetical protein [candidate division Zixibacteria bacterium]